MEKDKEIKKSENLFLIHDQEIEKAYQRAVREALIKHKRDGNYVVTSQDGEVVILQPSEIVIPQK